MEHLVDEGAVVLGDHHAAAGEQLPQDDAGRVDVGAPVDGALVELLRRHERHLALDLAGDRRRQARLGAGDAEVGQAGDAVDADEDVVRRDVAVDEAQGLLVRAPELVCGVEAGERVEEDAQRDVEREAAVVLAQRALDGVERGPLDVFHDEEDARVVLVDVERRDHVGVVDARGEARLVEEHGDEVGLVLEVLVHRLERDEPLEPADAHRPRQEHRGHAARRDLANRLVATTTHLHGGHVTPGERSRQCAIWATNMPSWPARGGTASAWPGAIVSVPAKCPAR